MVKRTQCLYQNKIIGIETIYIVINGKQINIPEKLTDLRMKSRNNELFCPCGCGANLILVAGEQNLREQHFRIKGNGESLECTYVAEGEVSVNSKVILKCWLDDKLKDPELAARVPISEADDTKRRYEFSFLSISRRVGVIYTREKENVTDEKLDILERNSSGIHLIHIVDINNLNQSGQFPEFLAKIQNRQGYCLFLEPYENDYYKSSLAVAVYKKDLDGFWKQLLIATDKLSSFEIDGSGELLYNGFFIKDLVEKALVTFEDEQNEIKRQREIRKESLKVINTPSRGVWLRQAERGQEQTIQNIRPTTPPPRVPEPEYTENREKTPTQKKWDEFNANLNTFEYGPNNIVSNPEGVPVFKCKYCGTKGYKEKFKITQGSIGVCNNCYKTNPEFKEERDRQKENSKQEISTTPVHSSNICPRCGRPLIRRSGRYGTFLGCTGYPGCSYTKNLQ